MYFVDVRDISEIQQLALWLYFCRRVSGSGMSTWYSCRMALRSHTLMLPVERSRFFSFEYTWSLSFTWRFQPRWLFFFACCSVYWIQVFTVTHMLRIISQLTVKHGRQVCRSPLAEIVNSLCYARFNLKEFYHHTAGQFTKRIGRNTFLAERAVCIEKPKQCMVLINCRLQRAAHTRWRRTFPHLPMKWPTTVPPQLSTSEF
jgi:hypothetical protein